MNWWTSILLLSLTCTAGAQISCKSPLRFRFPHLFSHCRCGVGQWTAFTFKEQRDCSINICQMGCNDSGYANVLERRREAIPPSCNPSEDLYESKEVCGPSVSDLAKQFIKTLQLGKPVSGSPGPPGPPGGNPAPPGRPGPPGFPGPPGCPTCIIIRPDCNSPGAHGCPSRRSIPEQYDIDPSEIPKSVPQGPATHSKQRQKRSHSCPFIANNAPSCGAERICPEITGNCRRKRSFEDPQVHAENVADLVLQQDHYYSMMRNPTKERTNRQKRQNYGTISRNVLIVIDSSGSIPSPTFDEVKGHLINLTYLLCGNISIGVMTYSTEIELVLCPTCYRSSNDLDSLYLDKVSQKIEDAAYHGRLTYTGEALACLRCSLMNSATCVNRSAPTEVIFFTDGEHNGCINPREEVAKLEADYSGVPIYAIGMGAINRNGVTDLYGGNRNPDSIFNVRNITMFGKVLEEIVRILFDTGGVCTLTDRSEDSLRDLLQPN